MSLYIILLSIPMMPSFQQNRLPDFDESHGCAPRCIAPLLPSVPQFLHPILALHHDVVGFRRDTGHGERQGHGGHGVWMTME